MKNNIFWSISLKYSYWFILGVVMSFTLTQVLVVGNTIIGDAADLLLAGQSVDMKPYVAELIILTLIGFASAYLAGLCSSYFTANVLGEFRKRTVSKLMKIEFSYFDDKGAGSIINKLVSDINETGRFFGETLSEMTQALIAVVTVSIYMVFLDWKLFLVVIVCYPVLMMCANCVSKKLQILAQARRVQLDERTSIAYDSVQGIVVGRSYNLNDIMFEKINKVIQAIFENESKRTKISSMSWVLQNTISWIPAVICYLSALYEVLNNTITIGSMFAFVVLLNRIEHSIEEIPFYLNDIREISVSMNRIKEIMTFPDEQSGNERLIKNDYKGNAIEFKNIDFSYGEASILKNMSLEIEQGKTTAFVGGSGQGKTTAFKLICGLYRVSGGEYLLYGRNFSKWDIDAARSLFSLVSQNVFLLPETIAENVSYGKCGASMEEIVLACKNANIHDFIMKLPDGYDTYIGERGVKLSGGERQRISIARAFLKDAPILLLDEPTSAIDVENENAIKEAIDRVSEGRTVIIIAHRLNTIVNADKIMVFSGGRITESGTHDELMKLNGEYASLYGKQESTVLEGGSNEA